MQGWAPLNAMVDRLREIAEAPRADWLRLAHQIEALPVVRPNSPAPIELQLMAAAAKHVVRQMPHAPVINETELRGVVMALSNVLENDMAQHVAAPSERAERDVPYWARSDR